MKLKKGDKVKIISGKDKGREGIIEKIYLKNNKVLIPNINIYKRHIKKNEKMSQGGIIEVPRPLVTAKLMLICPKCNKQTRIKIEKEKGKKFRVCKKCNSRI